MLGIGAAILIFIIIPLCLMMLFQVGSFISWCLDHKLWVALLICIVWLKLATMR